MRSHKKIIASLYEYLRGELAEDERLRVSDHLTSCPACRAEMEELRTAMKLIEPAADNPAEQRSDAYWRNFAIHVDQRIADRSPMAARARRTLGELLGLTGVGGYRVRQFAMGFAAALLIVGASVSVWLELRPHAHAPTEADNVVPDSTIQVQQMPLPPIHLVSNDTTNAQMLQYVRKTKMILVGITNMKDDGADVDISSERERSKALIQQARYLKSQPLDDRSAKLIDDLQMILTELANMKEQGNAPNVEILRSGVHHENLLFKIRMEEEKYAHAEKTRPPQKNKYSKHKQNRTNGDTI